MDFKKENVCRTRRYIYIYYMSINHLIFIRIQWNPTLLSYKRVNLINFVNELLKKKNKFTRIRKFGWRPFVI